MRFVLIGMLLLVYTIHSQQPPNPPQASPPQDIKAKEEPDIELNTVLMESTFMIEGRVGQGTALGTVFVIGIPIPNSTPIVARLVLVTAAHVL